MRMSLARPLGFDWSIERTCRYEQGTWVRVALGCWLSGKWLVPERGHTHIGNGPDQSSGSIGGLPFHASQILSHFIGRAGHITLASSTCTSMISPFSSGTGGISVRTGSFLNLSSSTAVILPHWMVPLDSAEKYSFFSWHPRLVYWCFFAWISDTFGYLAGDAYPRSM